MKIPKYILHPSLLLLSGGLLMWLLWQDTPTASEIDKSLTQNSSIQMPSALPALSQLSEISDISSNGKLIVTGFKQPIAINDPHFNNINANQKETLTKVLVGKLLLLDPKIQISSLSLPIELYDKLCFNSAAQQQPQNLCPMILKP